MRYLLILLFTAQALGATKYLQGDAIKSLDQTKTWTLPATTGNILSASSTSTVTNKSIDADTNTITNIENADIKASAAIDATKLADGSVTSTELQYINTLTANAQTALDAKTLKSTLTAKGSMYVASGASTPAEQAVGADGTVMVAQASAANGVAYAPMAGRNKVHNGAMIIDQRNEGASHAFTNNTAAVDRWFITASTSSATATVQRLTSSVPAGFNYATKVTLTAIDASLNSTDNLSIAQTIEGTNLTDLNFGLATAKSVTISFWVRASGTGTYCVNFRNGSGRSYVAEYTISVADTWEKKVVTLAGDTSGTWNKTESNVGAYLGFVLMAGSSHQGTGSTWLASNTQATSNQVNWAANASATFYITGVQLEKGNVATDFEWDDIEILYRKVKRFYQKTYPVGLIAGNTDGSGVIQAVGQSTVSTTAIHGQTTYNPRMYSSPTVTIYSDGAGTSGKVTTTSTNGDVGGTISVTIPTAAGFRYISGTGFIAGTVHTFHYTADTGL